MKTLGKILATGAVLTVLATPVFFKYQSSHYKDIVKNIVNQNPNISGVYDLEQEIREGLRTRIQDSNNFLEASREYVRLVSDSRTKKNLADCKLANALSEEFSVLAFASGYTIYIPGSILLAPLFGELGRLKKWYNSRKKNSMVEENEK